MGTSRKPDDGDRQRGKELSRLRRARGMTQAALALELGISMQQLGKYERGQNRMPVSRYDKAMAVLGNAPDRQVGFRDAQQAPFKAETTVKAQLDQLLERISSDVARCRELARRL